MERFLLWALAVLAGTVAFRGAVDAAELDGDCKVESAWKDTGRLDPEGAADADSFLGRFLIVDSAVLGLSVVVAVVVVVAAAFEAFLGLKLLVGTLSFVPSSFDLAVAVVETLVDLAALLTPTALSGFFASSLSFRFRMPVVLRIAVFSFDALVVGAGGGGIFELFDSEGSLLGSLSLFLRGAAVLGLDRSSRDGEDGRREVGDDDGGSDDGGGATVAVTFGGRFVGVGRALGRICLIGAADGAAAAAASGAVAGAAGDDDTSNGIFRWKVRKLSSSWSIEKKGVVRESTVGQRSEGREESAEQ